MSFVQVKCPECGGMLAVDANKRAAVCQFCGEAFVVQEAINNYNEYNETVNNYNTTHENGTGVVVKVYENRSKDFEIYGGFLNKYKGEFAEVVIPDKCNKIGAYAFCNTGINSVTIPNSVEYIGYEAFANCGQLKEIIIPESVTAIEGYAFRDCSKLQKVVFPSNLQSLGYKAFESCTNLTSVKLPDEINEIGKDIFSNCPRLSEDLKTGIYNKAKFSSFRNYWINNNKCQYCGGDFKCSFFGKIYCKKCGKKKDY